MISRWLQQLRLDWHAALRAHPRALAFLTVLVLLLPLGAGSGVWYLSRLLGDLPDEQAMGQIGEMAQATTVYDREDALAFTIYKEQRIEVPLDLVSPDLVRAVLAIEDQRFYRHQGFDPIRIGGALVANLRNARVAQGGSTITQQLARQSFLTPQKTIRRKVQELILAARLERTYTKPQILAMYLNKVYFGDGLYGVEAASRGYFGKHASELSIGEAATLAGVVQAPSNYAPTASIDRAIARRNIVLQALLETGDIDQATWASAREAPLELRDTLRAGEPYGRYFKEQVRQELVERFGWERVYEGGLRVYSTVDMDAQKAAEASVADGLQAIEKRRQAIEARRGRASTGSAPTPAQPLQAALIAMDPATGEVRALVGGRDFTESPFNRAVQAMRQPGSAFKPFVFAAALEAGFTPASMIVNLNEPIPTLEGDWTPEDHDPDVAEMTLRTALRTSSNRAAVRLLQEVGIPSAVKYAKDMGVGDQPAVPSLALGSGEVTLQTMTAAYAAFANQGRVPQPLFIRRVEDQTGQLLYTAEPSSTQAIGEGTAFLMADMLADVIDAGTAARARQLGFTLPAAGKTGTTNAFKDAWFIGFTPRLIAGVWVGFDEPRTILTNGFASDIAVPLWASFMKEATRDQKPEWINEPASIVTARVCRLSGKLAVDGCEHVAATDDRGNAIRGSMAYTEYFVEGTEPTSSCELHQPRGLFGTLASLFGGDGKPAPRLEDTGTAVTHPPSPAPPVASAGVEEPKTAEQPPAKKRGFWSRVFGIGKNKSGAAATQ